MSRFSSRGRRTCPDDRAVDPCSPRSPSCRRRLRSAPAAAGRRGRLPRAAPAPRQAGRQAPHPHHVLVRAARQPGRGGRVQPHPRHRPGRLPAGPGGLDGRVRQAQQRRPGGQRPGRRDDRVPPDPRFRHRRGRPGHHRPGRRPAARRAAAAGARPDHLRPAGLRRAAGRRADGDALPHRPVRRVRPAGPAHLGGVRGGGPDGAPQGPRPPPGGLRHGRCPAIRLVRLAGRLPSGSTPGRAPGTCRSPTRRAAASPRTGSG